MKRLCLILWMINGVAWAIDPNTTANIRNIAKLKAVLGTTPYAFGIFNTGAGFVPASKMDDTAIFRCYSGTACSGTAKTIKIRSTVAAPVSQPHFSTYSTNRQAEINSKQPAGSYALQSTTVNGHALSSNVTVSASDITTGTLPHAQLPTLLSGDIPIATSTAIGGVKPDGTSILNTAGAISVANPLNQNTTGSAAKLTTGRTIALTGGVSYTSPSFDGSGNVTAAATVNTNANLTGPITSVGNATSVTSQTGTGSKFVMDTNPSINGTLVVSSYTTIQGSGYYGDAATLIIGGTAGDMAMTTPTSKNMVFGIANQERLRILAAGQTVINSGTNTVYRCTGATNTGMLTINNALCVTGYATTSLKLD